MSTITSYQTPQAARTPTPPLVKLERNYWRYVTERWVAFLWRAAIWPVPVIFVVASLFLDRSSIITATLVSCPFSAVIWPILAVRRSFLINPPRPAPASSTIGMVLATLRDRRNLRLIGAYAFAAVAYACFFSYFSKPESQLGLFSPTSRHPWHLNERFVFVLLGAGIAGVWEGCKELRAGKLHPEWPNKRTPFGRAVWSTIVSHLDQICDVSTIMSYVSLELVNRVIIASYWLVQKSFWQYALWLSFGALRPFIVNFARNPKSLIHLNVLSTTALLPIELLFLTIVKIPAALMVPYVVQPLEFDLLTRKSGMSAERSILLALGSRDPYYAQLTTMELIRIVHSRERRKVIFSDVATNAQPDLTTSLWQELLVHLGRINQSLVTRGGTRTAVRSAPSAVPASRPSDARAIPLQQGAIFRSSIKQQSGIQSFFTSVLDGPIQATPQAVKKVQQLEGKGEEKAKEAAQGALEWAERKTITGPVLKQSSTYMEEHFWSQIGREWTRRQVALSLGDFALARRIIEIFVVLSVASLEEDTYGHVQHVLPATMEAIVRFRSNIVSLESDLLAQASALGKPSQAASALAKQTLSVCINTCDDAIRRISDGYGTSVSAFRFPPPIASALNEICKDAS